jgi:hypothetical protein
VTRIRSLEGRDAGLLAAIVQGISRLAVDVPDDFFGRVQQRFSEREIVELTAHIAQENYNAKSNRPLRVDANNFCEIPRSASKA